MKTIPLRDFVYLCIILGTITIAIVSLVLSNSETANSNLNFAATSVSIVLAVIAIVMSLIGNYEQNRITNNLESAVNKINESVLDLKEIKEIKDDLLDFKEESNRNFEEINKTMSGLDNIDKVLLKVKDMEQIVSDKLESIEKDSSEHTSFETLGDILTETKQELKEVQEKVSHQYIINNENYQHFRVANKELYIMILELFQENPDKEFTINRVVVEVRERFNRDISQRRIETILRALIADKEIHIIPNKKGSTYIKSITLNVHN